MTSSRNAHRRSRVVILTGLSGSGKSTATKVFEDIGYFCVDNLPAVLLPKIIDLVSEARGETAKIALVADVRGREFLPDFKQVVEDLRGRGHAVQVLFLDADDDVLLRRFSETRRKHPLAGAGGTKEGIRRERKVLSPLREMADTVLNTSEYTVHQLRDALLRRFRKEDAAGLRVSIVSFGYRYGIPQEADMVIDVRFLPNPNFVPALKIHTGLDRKVRAYVLSSPTTRRFLRLLTATLHFLLPLYTKEGKAYFTLGIGCTGGRHRSVAIAEALSAALARKAAPVVVHRDLHRDSPPRQERAMIGTVVISHGRLATELLRAAEIIVGKVENAVAVDIDPKMGMDEIRRAIEGAIRAVDRGKGALLLTDMFGGTPSNIGLSFLGTHQVEVVTGVNLPMMVKLPMARATMSLSDLARHLQEYGQRNITIPGDMLKKKVEKK